MGPPQLSLSEPPRDPEAPAGSGSPLFPLRQRVFPYISAMVNNGSLTYDHDRDGRPTELGGCTAMVRNLNHDTFLVIRYVKRRLTVSPAGSRSGEWGKPSFQRVPVLRQGPHGAQGAAASAGADRHRRQTRVEGLHRRARRAPAPRVLLWDVVCHRGPLRYGPKGSTADSQVDFGG